MQKLYCMCHVHLYLYRWWNWFVYFFQLNGLGLEESDSDSDMDEPDISHMPAVHNPLTDLQYAELLLRYPLNVLLRRDNCRDVYIAVRHYVHSCCNT